MLRSRIRYYSTWLALALLLISGLFLLVASWNSQVNRPFSPLLVILFWVVMTASGIFIFMLAVKKAHRLWIDEERSLREKESEAGRRPSRHADRGKNNQIFDFAAIARKLVRRIPESASMKEVSELLLKNLARELEIMSGIFYVRKKTLFEPIATYAINSPVLPSSFREGEGLNGQVSLNMQIMLITRLPEEFLEVYSGLGSSRPSYLVIVPFIHKNRTIAVLECTGFRYDPHEIENLFRVFSRDLMEKISPNLK